MQSTIQLEQLANLDQDESKENDHKCTKIINDDNSLQEPDH